MIVQKTRTYIIIAAFIVFVISLLGGCGNSGETSSNDKVTHTVTVKTEGGMRLSDQKVIIYKDSSMENLLWASDTDKNGEITFEAVPSENYVAVFEESPKGYLVEQTYFVSENTEIVLKPYLTNHQTGMESSYKLGDVYFDFCVEFTDGSVYTLSEILSDKKAVVLNFWYLECVPCKMEFPFLQEAYEEYKDEVEVLAINPMDGDKESISNFAKDLGLTFPMIKGENGWQTCMNLASYPTTVVIDRYGTISLIHKGSVTDKETFLDIFSYFTAEGYTQTTVRNISDIQ